MPDETDDVTLYMRGMKKEAEEDMNNAWDDTALNTAYDEAMKITKAILAKRIAMATNSKPSANPKKSNKKSAKATAVAETKQERAQSPKEWKEGMPCRAVYEEDGKEYEAFLLNFADAEECNVKFIGYENEEQVPISSLKRSLGDKARMKQIKDADMEATKSQPIDDAFLNQPDSESVDQSSCCSMPELRPTEMLYQNPKPKNKKKKGNKKRPLESPRTSHSDLPSLHMPDINMIRNLGGPEMPLPPPPMPQFANLACGSRSDEERQIISEMLLSWYMTGYYTGLYQGQKKQKHCQRCH